MLKTLALSASVLAFAGGVVFAETAITRRSVANALSSLSTDRRCLRRLWRCMTLPKTRWARYAIVGAIQNGNVAGAIIGVGGFLGVGEKDVVIPFKELKASIRDGKDWLILNRTKDELKRAPEVNNTFGDAGRRSRMTATGKKPSAAGRRTFAATSHAASALTREDRAHFRLDASLLRSLAVVAERTQFARASNDGTLWWFSRWRSLPHACGFSCGKVRPRSLR